MTVTDEAGVTGIVQRMCVCVDGWQLEGHTVLVEETMYVLSVTLVQFKKRHSQGLEGDI